jgi:hypothetical protein
MVNSPMMAPEMMPVRVELVTLELIETAFEGRPVSCCDEEPVVLLVKVEDEKSMADVGDVVAKFEAGVIEGEEE